MKRSILITWLLLRGMQLVAQPKTEIREFSGIVRDFQPGYTFAYEFIHVEVEGLVERFHFTPNNGALLLSNFKPGDPIAMKVRLNLKLWEETKKADAKRKEFLWYFSRQGMLEVRVGDKWVPTPEERLEENKDIGLAATHPHRVFLERPILQFYEQNGRRSAAVLDGNLVAEYAALSRFFNPLKSMKVGDKLSFVGLKHRRGEGYAYPIAVSEVYTLSPLTAKTGTLKAYLHKQNYVCIGVKFETASGDMQVSIPSDKAVAVQKFIKPGRKVTFYHSQSEEEELGNLSPELHCVIMDRDTLMIGGFAFFGGADVKHDFKPVQFEGKVKELTRSDKGRLLGVIVDNTYFFEIDPRFEQQIGDKIRRGIPIAISGSERIKKEGEVYSKDYRIVTPDRITIDGKVYLLNQP